jgi:hypothetical protein
MTGPMSMAGPPGNRGQPSGPPPRQFGGGPPPLRNGGFAPDGLPLDGGFGGPPTSMPMGGFGGPPSSQFGPTSHMPMHRQQQQQQPPPLGGPPMMGPPAFQRQPRQPQVPAVPGTSSMAPTNVPNGTAQQLAFEVVHSTGAHVGFPARNLEVLDTAGWQSERFCLFPQTVDLAFPRPDTEIVQLQLLSHQYMISSKVQILVGSGPDLAHARFTNLGFVRFDDNQRSKCVVHGFHTWWW